MGYQLSGLYKIMKKFLFFPIHCLYLNPSEWMNKYWVGKRDLKESFRKEEDFLPHQFPKGKYKLGKRLKTGESIYNPYHRQRVSSPYLFRALRNQEEMCRKCEETVQG